MMSMNTATKRKLTFKIFKINIVAIGKISEMLPVKIFLKSSAYDQCMFNSFCH